MLNFLKLFFYVFRIIIDFIYWILKIYFEILDYSIYNFVNYQENLIQINVVCNNILELFLFCNKQYFDVNVNNKKGKWLL